MGRRQYKVPDGVAYRWVERHRRGESFRKIALDAEVDRRLVARIVRGLDKAKHLDEIAAALRDVRVAFLREHLEVLERATYSLLEITVPPSLRGSACITYLNVGVELVKKLKIDRLVANAPELAPCVDLNGDGEEIKDPQQLLKWQLANHRAEREAKLLAEDLKEHLPELWPAVDKWEGAAANYEASWRNLAKLARDKGIPQDQLELGLKVGLTLLPKFKQGEDLPRIPLKLETASDVGIWLVRNGGTTEFLHQFHRYGDQLEAAYVRLEDMLNPFELRKALLERQCKHCPLA